MAQQDQSQKFSKEPTEVLREGKEYTHATGGKFKYPKNWTVKEGDGYLLLSPPDAKEGEIILITAESAEGQKDPGSAEVLAYLDSQIAESIPDARRSGKIENTVAGAGKGVIVTWKGSVSGTQATIRSYVTIVKGYGVALTVIGSQVDIEKRDPILRQIFQSIGWGQGKIDERLVGTWNYWGYKGTSDGKYGREEKVRAVLRADGTFTYSNQAETSITASGEGWSGGMASRRGDGYAGTWTADGSTIYLNFEDGTSETFEYRFEQQGANVFLVTSPEDKKHRMEWSKG